MRYILIALFLLQITAKCFTQSEIHRIEQHLTAITKTKEPRHYKNIDQLNETAEYIFNQFAAYTDSVNYQNIENLPYKNVIASFGTENTTRIIVGAHYDVCGDQEGADDNASGIVGLLELARLLKDQKLTYRIDLVAFSLEEPPFFRTDHMGSYVHAKWLKDQNIDVFGMIAIEMIGYFDDAKGSQSYPLGFLSLFYGKRGNYITLVKKIKGGKFVRKMIHTYKRTKSIRTKKFSAPDKLEGIDFSDHLNYWNMGFNALMITDTAFYRNKNYHQKTDTMETLDLKRMAKVIDGLYLSLLSL